MITGEKYIAILLFCLLALTSEAQTDNDPPLPPVLALVSVQTETGMTELTWIRSTSPDVTGYVVYYFRNGEGFAFDTIFNPLVSNYINTGSFANFRTESYVVAALDTAGNISPLSNTLNTIILQSELDTCNKKIILEWNQYPSVPKAVTAYNVYISENGGPWNYAGETGQSITFFETGSFTTGSSYCFYVKAVLEDGNYSASSKSCLEAEMEKPPAWINADYATVTGTNEIKVSFSIDPASEIRTFRVDRKTSGELAFRAIAQVESVDSEVIYTDSDADSEEINLYRLQAINNCGNAVVTSNLCSNISLSLQPDESSINLAWNGYRQWNGGVKLYSIEINRGDGFAEIESLQPADTSFVIEYKDIMYSITSDEVCFLVKAVENLNQYGKAAESISNQACTELIEKIYVPNAFTPDGDMVNDYFAPVLSFTPVSYRLIITDRQNNRLFETTDYLEKWDGRNNGAFLSRDVYLWYVSAATPSGRTIRKSGTVTIIKTGR
jgi:gliding motility-associated-like protein